MQYTTADICTFASFPDGLTDGIDTLVAPVGDYSGI